MNKQTPSKLSRAQLTEALDSVPVSHILGKSVSRELTGKQKAFALEVAKGSSGAEAYRKAYKTRTKSLSQSNEASRLKARPDVAAEVAAYKAALDAEKYRTPAGLRSLIIQSLVQTLIDPDTPPAVRVQAAKVAGQITEVAAFTERREVKTITSSETARAQVMEQLRTLIHGSATDAHIIDAQADSLLSELASGESVEAGPHPGAAPQTVEEESLIPMHTIPHEQSLPVATQSENPSLDDAIFGDLPQSAAQETPPGSV